MLLVNFVDMITFATLVSLKPDMYIWALSFWLKARNCTIFLSNYKCAIWHDVAFCSNHIWIVLLYSSYIGFRWITC